MTIAIDGGGRERTRTGGMLQAAALAARAATWLRDEEATLDEVVDSQKHLCFGATVELQ